MSLTTLLQAVLAPSQVMPENADVVQGWDFVHGCTLDELLSSFVHTGFQATAFGRAVNEVNRMVCPDNRLPHASMAACLQANCCTHGICLASAGECNGCEWYPSHIADAAAGLAPQ